MLIASAIFGVLMGLLFAWIAWGSAWSLWAALRGEEAQGKVVRVKTIRSKPQRPVPHVAVEFTTAAGETVQYLEANPSYGDPGSLVAVRYLPRRPKRATLARPRDLWRPVVTFTILGALFITTGVLGLLGF